MAYKEWTTQEYEIVVNHNQLSDQELADLLPGRAAGAVGRRARSSTTTTEAAIRTSSRPGKHSRG